MASPLNPHFKRTFAPPVMEARRWLEGVTFAPDQPLINVSQAAPMEPPVHSLRQAIAEIVQNDPSAHLYGPVLGLPELRAKIAHDWRREYHGAIDTAQVAITSGCNQAFTATLSTLAGPGDEVILTTPWYFNHKMHLDMAGVRAVPLPSDQMMLPDPEQARALITGRSRAIVLVTPNNPAGVEYPPALLAAFRDLARAHGLALIVDETYRDFRRASAPAHALFEDPDWDDTLIHLYSFSKAYRLTGHRVGAIVASQARLAQVEKYLDTVTICPNQIAQRAALWGMNNLAGWLGEQRREILHRRAGIEEGIAPLAARGWRLRGLGAYFAYLEHPFDASSAQLAPEIVRRAGVLMLPGTMFRPSDDPAGAREFRIAYANIDRAGIATLLARLENLRP